MPKIIQDERQSGEIPLGLATCTFPPWSTVAQMNTSFGVKSLPTNSAVSCKRFEKLEQKLVQVAGNGYRSFRLINKCQSNINKKTMKMTEKDKKTDKSHDAIWVSTVSGRKRSRDHTLFLCYTPPRALRACKSAHSPCSLSSSLPSSFGGPDNNTSLFLFCFFDFDWTSSCFTLS